MILFHVNIDLFLTVQTERNNPQNTTSFHFFLQHKIEGYSLKLEVSDFSKKS